MSVCAELSWDMWLFQHVKHFVPLTLSERHVENSEKLQNLKNTTYTAQTVLRIRTATELQPQTKYFL